MKLRSSYTLIAPDWKVGTTDNALQYKGPGCVVQIEPTDTPGRWTVVVEGTVDPLRLSLATRNLPTTDSGESAKMLVSPEAGSFHGFLQDVINALSFLYGRTLSVHSNMSKVLVPEGPADDAVLAKFGTTEPYQTVLVRFEICRTVADIPPSQELIDKLIKRSPGLRLYAGVPGPVARYRDLWLVLESAFGVDGDELIALLAEYPPVAKRGLSRENLEQLRVIRGRASHAATKAPGQEWSQIEDLVSEHLGTLLSLVDLVILTKKSWATPTTGVERLPIPSSSWGERVFDT
jgi:hypothetical protein